MNHNRLALKRPAPAFLSALLALVLSISVAACGGGGAGGGGAAEQTDPLSLFVDAVNGSDDNAGTDAAPFKTISHALAVVAPGGSVKIRKGLYDDANGELFPLQVPGGVRLLGSLFGNKPMVVGQGLLPDAIATNRSATLVPGVGSTITGLHLMSTPGVPGIAHSVIAAAFSGATISFCVVERGTFGIHAMNNAVGLIIRGCRVTGAQIGLAFQAAGHNSLVEKTTARNNATGVALLGQLFGVDLGGGIQSSKGLNAFFDNAEVDLSVFNGTSVSARNNFWDGSPDPSEHLGTSPPLGIDVLRRGPQASVDTTGALDDQPSINPLDLPDAPQGGIEIAP